MNVGTDCTGMDAVGEALNNLGVKYNYKFASDINKFCRMSIEANHKPEILYEDMTIPRILPKLDLYVAGFPCQPFSSAGFGKGPKDSRCIFPSVLNAIHKTEPKFFILENVKRIMSFKKYFNEIVKSLEALDYVVNHSVYNTKDYGIPQSRNRLYIIGVKKGLGTYKVPSHLPLLPHFIEEIDNYDVYSNTVQDRYETIKDTTFCNVNIQRVGSVIRNKSLCNTITANGYVWCIARHRKATIQELLRLQGFTSFKQVVSDSQIKRQIGNSMSVNVIQEIIKSCLISTE